MAKKKATEAVRQRESVTLKQVLAEPEYLSGRILKNEDVVFLRVFGKGADLEVRRDDIDPKMLKREVVAIQRNFGGVDHKYSSVRFVVK